MDRKSALLIMLTVVSFIEIRAQATVGTGKPGDNAFKKLEEVNALMFRPAGYDTVMNPQLPDSLRNPLNLSRAEAAEMHKKRVRFNPYLVFYNTIELKKGGILVSCSNSWIRLSAYYKYNNDSSSVEAYRKRVNQNLLGKNMIGYSPDFELLEDIKDARRAQINADTVFIYDTKTKYRFKDSVDNYGCLLVHLVKFDLGYISLRYFYPLHQRHVALSEITNTWGIVRFRPDREFTHPDHTGMIPPAKAPDLYLGKFSFLNNPEQVRREQEQYEQRMLTRNANALAREAVRLVQSKHTGQAKEKFSDVLRTDSNNVLAYRYLLLIAMDENKQDDSWKYWNKLFEKDPENSETWFLKGLAEKRYGEPDSAAATFEMIVQKKDALHFRSFIELAAIAVLKKDLDAADRYFNQAINVFKTEGEKSLQKKSHRMLNINDLFMVRMAYARFLNTNAAFEKSKMLFEQTLQEEAAAAEAGKKGERQTIYGKLDRANLAELHVMLALSYAGLKEESNTRLHLEKAKSLGKALPEELDRLLGN